MKRVLFIFLLSLLATTGHAAGIRDYSTSAGNNTALFPEPMPAGDVNDAARQMMADVRSFYEAPQWIDLGFTPTRTTSNTFTVSGDKTTYFPAGRRIRMTDALTYYGTISSSSYSAPNTSVDVTMDSGELSTSLSAVAVGLVDGVTRPVPASSLSGTISNTNISSSVTGYLVPVGTVLPYASSTAPTGWLVAGGQSVSRTTYAALFAVIGTTYGSVDGNSFNVPDLRGRVVAGLDNMGGIAASRVSFTTAGISGTVLGASGGDQRMQAHTHTASVTDPGHTHEIYNAVPGGGLGTNQSIGQAGGTFSSLSATTGITVSNSTAGAGTSQNMQPTMMLVYIIKY